MDGHERWTERLSEHVDGLLPDEESRRMDAHLAGCAECRRTRSELEAVKADARSLRDVPPGRDLWAGIRDSLHATPVIPLPGSQAPSRPSDRRQRGLFLTLPQLAAAATVLLALGGAAVWSAGPRGMPVGERVVEAPAVVGAGKPAAREELAARTAAVDREIVTSYASEVERLETLLADGRNGLDAETVRVLEKNLGIIDRAIGESLDALDADPGNPWVRDHLRRSWERKVAYLRETADYLDPVPAD